MKAAVETRRIVSILVLCFYVGLIRFYHIEGVGLIGFIIYHIEGVGFIGFIIQRWWV
jgi:hypothetical protein